MGGLGPTVGAGLLGLGDRLVRHGAAVGRFHDHAAALDGDLGHAQEHTKFVDGDTTPIRRSILRKTAYPKPCVLRRFPAYE